MKNDTIAAIATAPGTGGISIIRISGPEAERILRQHGIAWGTILGGGGEVGK